ncbi:MAG: extracellular solute-binding protein, partial [Oscillospiraceae bacterium]|nr:extracellular solute-binding protein [Oscillospiraceae bacterium]
MIRVKQIYFLIVALGLLSFAGCANESISSGSSSVDLSAQYADGAYYSETVCDLSDYGVILISDLWNDKIYFVSDDRLYFYSFETEVVSAIDYSVQSGFHIAAIKSKDNRLSVAEVNQKSLVVKSIDENGGDIKEIAAYDNLYDPVNIKIDSENRIFFISNNKLYFINENGEQYDIKVDSPVYQLITDSTGKVCALIWKNNAFHITSVNAAQGRLDASIVMPGVKLNYACFDGDSAMETYFLSGSDLYGVNLTKGEIYNILDFTKADVPAQNISSVFCRTGDVICVVVYPSFGKSEIVRIADTPRILQKEKTVLTLALFSGWDGAFMIHVAEFNRSNPDYRIEVERYDQTVTHYQYGYADDDSGIQRFMLDVTAGKIPDIIDVSTLPAERLAQKGLFEDLYPMMDADAEINRSVIYPSILKALEIDGQLYTTMSKFQLPASYGRKELIGSIKDWTVEEAINLVKNKTVKYIYNIPAKYFLTTDFCPTYANQFVNWENGDCTFDSPEFISLLKMLKYLPADWDYSENTNDYLLSGIGLANRSSFISEEDAPDIAEPFYDEYIFRELPGTDYGLGMIFDDSPQLAISSACKDKTAAWEFVRTMFSESYQEQSSVTLFSTNIRVQTKSINDRIAALQEAGIDSGYIMPRFEKIMNVLENSRKIYRIDYALYDIIVEEALGYLAGDKTAAEIAAVIQSRASLYVA